MVDIHDYILKDWYSSGLIKNMDYYNKPQSFTFEMNPIDIALLKKGVEQKPKKCYRNKCNNDAEITFMLTYKMPEFGEMKVNYRSVSVCKDHLTKIVKQKKDGISLHFPSNIH